MEAAREREKAALERDTATRVHNQLLALIEVLRRVQTRGSDESRTHPSQPRATDTACIGGQPKASRSAFSRCEERSDESEPHKPTETPRIEDPVEMVMKRIDEDKS